MINNNSHSFAVWKEFLVLLIGGLVVVGAFVMYAKYDQNKVSKLDDTISSLDDTIASNNVIKIIKPSPTTTMIAQTVTKDTYILKWMEAERARDYETDSIKIAFELQNTDPNIALMLDAHDNFVMHSANNTWYYAGSITSGGQIISYPRIFAGQTLRGTLDFQLPKDVAIASISYLDHTININIPALSI